MLSLRSLNTLGGFFAISTRGDTFCNFRFALLHIKHLSKVDLLNTEIIIYLLSISL